VQRISDSTVRRLSLYLRLLEEFQKKGVLTVSSEELAGRSGTTAAQVRKDLSFFGSFGKRGLGYEVSKLVGKLREILGLSRTWPVVLVGAGRIGSALFEYTDFRKRGFEIVAVVDADARKVGKRWKGLSVRPVEELEDVVRREKVEIAILTVPVDAVQDVAERAIRAGVRGILNFAPTRVKVPKGVALHDVNMAIELEALSFELSQS
jgi:redox-sensing transcriptional repressor